jgi:Ser/Thr protein kinase RdoA (MazF antagonist)
VTDSHPYSRLTPDVVLNALEGVGLRCDGRLLALNSYENRVYQVGLDEGTVVAKFYRPARWSDDEIREEHEFALELAAAEIPMVAPLAFDGRTLLHAEGFRVAVYPRRGGRAPEMEDPETLEWIGRFVGRIHAIGSAKPFAHRPRLDLRTFADEPREVVLGGSFVPKDIRPAWTTAIDLAIESVRATFERFGPTEEIRVHGDAHAGNILWTPATGNAPGGPHFVDLDDARMAPAVQDLWLLLSGDRASMEQQLGKVLRGYEDFREFDDRELQLVEALRTLRLIQYQGWLARRWDDPAFPIAFPWFNTPRYWQDRVLEMREQIAAMNEPPLRPR